MIHFDDISTSLPAGR